MALNFPSNPNIDDTYTAANGIEYKWNGNAWTIECESGGATDHTLLDNIGTNTHAQIDTHIVDDSIHPEYLDDLSDVDVSGSPPAMENQVLMKSASDWVAASALTNIKLVGYEEQTIIDNTGAFDYTAGNFFSCTPVGDITISPVVGTMTSVSATIHMDNTAGIIVTMPVNMEWVGGVPTLGAKYIFVLYTLDGGANWFSVYIGDLV